MNERNDVPTSTNHKSSPWNRAGLTLLVAALVVWAIPLLGVLPSSVHSWSVSLAFTLLAPAASLLLGSLIVALLDLFYQTSPRFRWISVGTIFLLFNLLHRLPLTSPQVAAILAVTVLAGTLIGLGWGLLAAGSPTRRFRSWLLLAAGIVTAVGAVAWGVWPGDESVPAAPWVPPYADAEREGEVALADPAVPGPHTVRYLTYGAGTDRHRPEFAADADLLTGAVSVAAMVTPAWTPVQWLRDRFWGFGLDQVPLNGRTWYPDGPGPWPLVLMVHGNHSMYDFSDPGYEYLGELLASRGYVAVSVDQNFLNGDLISGVFGSLGPENDARGYLLLRHLELWHQWNADPASPFYGRVDTERIALLGHSRGGEAAALAAAFNELSAHPGDGLVPLDFGFNIQAVIAIAPSDGQYQPRQQSTPLQGISYLTLQGAVDSDVRSFLGARQYDRVALEEGSGQFKAAVLIPGANHGQFNTEWGRVDLSALIPFMNRRSIMSGTQQRQAAAVFVSGFLEAALGSGSGLEADPRYADLFFDPRLGRTWLPETEYFVQAEAADVQWLAHYGEDLDLQTASIPGGRWEGENLTVWREEAPPLAVWGRRDRVSVRLGWDTARLGTGLYRLHLPDAADVLQARGSLTFAAASVRFAEEPVAFTVRLVDGAGVAAELAVSVPGRPDRRILKPPLRAPAEPEPVFQTIELPLSAFAEAEPGWDGSRVERVEFVFDRTPSGELYLDDVGTRYAGI